ncbi:MAG: hypothetical protein KJ709_04435, partial [Nanoarchaeota archaeon]|nr:hypothetical protein [Nanoarchaeota archaeon]
MNGKIIMLVIICLISIQIVIASKGVHVTGDVLDALDGTAAAPRYVMVYIPEDESRNSTCQNTPDPDPNEYGKYTCQLEDEPWFDWRQYENSTMSVRVLDDGFVGEGIPDGYVGGPVNVTLYSDSTNQPPDMQLHPAIQISSPEPRDYGANPLRLDASLWFPYHRAVYYSLDGS